MKKIEMISENAAYSAATIGGLNQLNEHVYSHPAGFNVPGKVFVGEALHCTGTEVSFQMMPPKMDTPFYHTHKENEELYVVIRGKGEFQVDNDIFPIAEGALIRVAPQGKRTWRNTEDEPMIMMVIQSKAGSLPHLGIVDGVKLDGSVKW